MKGIIYIVGLLLSLACHAKPDEQFLIVVKRNYSPRPENETVTVVLDYNEVVKRLPEIKKSGLTVINQNFGLSLAPDAVKLYEHQSRNKIAIQITFTSSEPIYTLTLKTGNKKLQVMSGEIQVDPRLDIAYLMSYADFVHQGKTVESWPDRIVESTMKTYPDPALLSINAPGNWNYEYGFFLNGVMEQWQRNKKPSYFDYAKLWADRYLDANGVIDKNQYNVSEYRLDDILPGRLFITFYKISGEVKYRNAAASLEDHLLHQPRTTEGGYWHKQIYPNQMWLDGIYMGDVFATQYASVFNKPDLFNESIHQIKLIAQHTRDAKTGLFFHGWDESKNNVWADQQTGTSHEFWGRGLGWYLMALVDCLDYIPKEHPQRKDVEMIFQELATTLAHYQDKNTALWFQVIDKGNAPGNWIETSCSAMFAYAFAKGFNKGLLEESFYDRGLLAFNALISHHIYFDLNGLCYLDQTVKVATLNPKVSKGDYAYYVGLERRINDYKGLAALLYASIEITTKQKTPH